MWKNTKDIKTHKVRMLLYGATGSGKTTAAATAPNPLFIVPGNENSHVALQGRDIPFTTVNSMSCMDSILNDLLVASKGGELGGYGDTVVVESLTHYASIVQEELAGTKGGVMNQHLWGRLSTHFDRLRNVLWQLDAHVILTGLDTVRMDDDGVVVRAGLRLPGAQGELLPSSCDSVGYCQQTTTKDGRKFRVHFKQRGHYPARSRIPALDGIVAEPFVWSECLAPLLVNK